MGKAIYYLPGQGGHLHQGLGLELLRRGFDVVGREIQGEFKKLSFSNRVATIAFELQSAHWSEDSLVIANSYGAYQLLHAQAKLPPYIGNVLLLSPIVGEFSNGELMLGFKPPLAKKLREQVLSGKFPVPRKCEIHVGSEDWQCNPENVGEFAAALGIPMHIVPNNGHALDKNYVSELLDKWLVG